MALPRDELEALRGHPEAVLKAIDDYSESHERFMNIGPIKGSLIVEKIRALEPDILIELGGYVGYLAILFGNEILKFPDARYFSFEANEDFAAISRQLVDLAGLSSVVEIIVGKGARSLPAFSERLTKEKGSYVSIDFVFIDHWKDLYVPDLRVLESLNLLAPGTLLAADNIYRPGAPGYVEYVQSSPEWRRDHNQRVPNVSGKQFSGRWNVMYDSKTVPVKVSDGFEDAVEFTEVVEYLSG